MPEIPQEHPEAAAAEDLGQSYQTLLGQQNWEVDAGPEVSAPSEVPANADVPVAPPSPLRIIEALLFVGGTPLTPARAGEAIRGLTAGQFVQVLDTLNRDYRRQGRPYAIQLQDQGYVLTLRSRYRPVLEKVFGPVREARLSPAAVDVLALVAYRQPATKQEIDSVRGAESGGILRQLVRRGLVAVVHRAETGHQEVSYGTTERFLKLFGLQSLDDLPRAQDLQRI